MDVEIVESSALSADHLRAWSDLFDAVPQACFYHHPYWHQCIARHLSPGKLQFGFLRMNNQLNMLLPLCDSVGERHRAHPTHDHLSLNDVLIHPELAADSDALLHAINLTLNKPGSHWWDWTVTNVPHHGALVQALSTIDSSLNDAADTSVASVQTVHNNRTQNWLLKQTRQSASFDCITDERPPRGKLRRNLRRLRKQLQERGDVTVQTVTDSDQLGDAYQHFLHVEASGWKGANAKATAIADDPELKAFYRALLTPASTGFCPEINLLWLDDNCVAAQFGIRTGAQLNLLKIGYDETYAHYSPGYLLLESILNGTQDRSIDTVSLVTSPPWAERWHPDTVPVWQLQHYNQSPVGIALHRFEKFKLAAKSRLRQAA